MFASLVILDAAIGRFPNTITSIGPITQNLILLGLFLPMFAFDLASLRKINRVTIICWLVVAVWLFTRIPLGMTSPWLKFATLMRG